MCGVMCTRYPLLRWDCPFLASEDSDRCSVGGAEVVLDGDGVGVVCRVWFGLGVGLGVLLVGDGVGVDCGVEGVDGIKGSVVGVGVVV